MLNYIYTDLEKGNKKMKGLKDFLYDKNDILIALIILIVAALLIVWRMDVIMEYPHTLAEETGTQVTTDDTAVDDDAAADSSNDDTSQDEGDSAQTDTLWSGDALAHDVTVTVQGGSATAAVQSLMDAGLFESYDQFTQVCASAGCKPENIKATTFTFAAGSTQADIARLVTD